LAAWGPERIGELRVRPWLASIVVNLSRNRRRRGAGRPRPVRLAPLLAAGFDPVADPADGPDATGLRREEAARWAERLLRCPPAQRAAVVLRHVDGLSYEDVAGALGRPVGTIKAQVHRGLARLRADLVEEEARHREELTA
jgi:RNA polymerase sigma-70 factor (ECF subfamily)